MIATTFLILVVSCQLKSAQSVDIAVHSPKRRCQKITIPMCQMTLPYSTTELPNSLGHYSQKIVHRSLEIYSSLMHTNCSKDLAFFLCAYHLPVCMSGFAEPIRPCRSVCEKVKADCAGAIRLLGGSTHSDSVRCQELPAYETGVCIKEDSFVKSGWFG